MGQASEDKTLIGIFTTDAALTVQLWDDVMRTMTGVAQENAAGRHISDLIPDLQSRGLLTRFERVRDLGTVEVLSATFHRFLLRCKPRLPSSYFSEMRQMVTISPIREGEDISGVMVMIEDVTERLERSRDLAARLRDHDDNVRLEAAKSVSRGSDPLSPESTEAVVGALGDRNWRVRRNLVEGLSKRISPETIGSLLTAFRDGHLDFGLLNSALRVLQSASPETARSLVQFLRSEDSDLRIQATLALGELNNTEVVPDLLAALKDDNANVRYHAIEALGKLKAADAVEPLLSIAETRNFFLAFPALESLAKIGGEGVAKRVLPLFDDPDLSEAASETLAAMAGPEVVPAILENLENGRISALAGAAALCRLLDRHSDATDKAEIVDNIARSIGPTGIEAVAVALQSASGPAASQLVRMAGFLDDPRIRESLVDLLADDDLRDEAIASLTAHGESGSEALIAVLDSEDRSVRSAAARALGGFNSPAALQALISALDQDEETAAMAARSLGQSTDPAAFDALIEVLSTENRTLQRHVALALQSISRRETGPRLCGLLEQQTDARVREALVRIMGGLDSEECAAAIAAACSDEDALVRAAAIEQLPNFQIRDVNPRLETALKDDDARVRASAAKALGQIAGTDSVRSLRAALSDDDPWTRYFAVRSLAALGDPDSEEVLRTMSEHDDAEQVRAAAAEAISGR